MASGGAGASTAGDEGAVASTSQGGGGSCTLSRKSFAGSTGSSLGRGDRRQRTHLVDTSDEELDNSQVRMSFHSLHFRLLYSNWIWKFNWKTNEGLDGNVSFFL